jgi:hypothetical protein
VGDCASSGGDNVKHFNLIPSTSMNGAANAVTRVVPSGKAVLAPFAALLITAFALGTAGCGKSKNNQSASQSQPVPQSVSNQNLAETAPSTIPVAVNQPDTGKKSSVKGPVRRASVRTFKDSDSGVSFLYPRKAVLKAGENAEKDSTSQDRLPMNYIAPGGLTLASVELPSNKKDEPGDLFLLNVNEELTADQCSQFPSDSQIGSEESTTDGSVNQQPVFTPGLKTSFRGLEYSELDKQNVQSVIRYYHRYVPGDSADKGVCYEFSMLVNAEPKQDAASATSEHKDVFTKLEKILASVKIESKKSHEAIETATSDSNKENQVLETAKTNSGATTDSSVKSVDDHAAETAKAIVKDESPR